MEQTHVRDAVHDGALAQRRITPFGATSSERELQATSHFVNRLEAAFAEDVVFVFLAHFQDGQFVIHRCFGHCHLV